MKEIYYGGVRIISAEHAKQLISKALSRTAEENRLLRNRNLYITHFAGKGLCTNQFLSLSFVQSKDIDFLAMLKEFVNNDIQPYTHSNNE